MITAENIGTGTERMRILESEIDSALAAQIIVAWAGESGEEKRLGWWRCDLISEFGGRDLFERLLPNTAPWAVLQAAREAARRKDAEFRRQAHDPDRLLTLFNMGFELDERLEERLQDLKRSGMPPDRALPALRELNLGWSGERFAEWVSGHGDIQVIVTPSGRQLAGATPSTLDRRVHALVGALSPLANNYPMPHFRRSL